MMAKKKSDSEEVVKPKKKTMVVARVCTCTNPYTKDVYTKGIPRELPRKKCSWYKSQIEGKYLEEVKI